MFFLFLISLHVHIKRPYCFPCIIVNNIEFAACTPNLLSVSKIVKTDNNWASPFYITLWLF